VGFSKGRYATFKNFKIFYKLLKDSKSPNNNLIIGKALNLFDRGISRIRKTKVLYEESEVFNVLASRGKWGRSSK